jgi:anthranilate synthase component 1
MHLVSTGRGQLADQYDHLDALVSCFPGRAPCPAPPKIRAMQNPRGAGADARDLYAGAVGYIDFAGNLDFCIAIRTITIATAWPASRRAPASVADSNPPPSTRKRATRPARSCRPSRWRRPSS